MALPQLIFTQLILLVVVTNYQTEGNAAKFLYMDHVDCQFSKVLLASNASCRLTFLNRTQKAFSLKMFALKSIEREDIHYNLLYRYRTGYRTFLVDSKDNYCDYVTKENVKSKVLNFVIPTMQAYSNVKMTCPFVGSYEIDNMPLNAEIFDNPFLPVGKHYLNITFTHFKELVASIQFYFTVPEGKTIEDDGMGHCIPHIFYKGMIIKRN